MPSRCICRAARLAHPRYSGCSCRAGLRQFARRIQLETVVVKEEELPDRRQCQQRVEWSVAEVQQLQALLLKPPPEQATPDAMSDYVDPALKKVTDGGGAGEPQINF